MCSLIFVSLVKAYQMNLILSKSAQLTVFKIWIDKLISVIHQYLAYSDQSETRYSDSTRRGLSAATRRIKIDRILMESWPKIDIIDRDIHHISLATSRSSNFIKLVSFDSS